MPITGLVSISIVTWNSAEHLPRCLSSLLSQNYPSVELIVVDNASADDSVAIVKQLAPAAIIVCNRENSGFCRAHNAAIALAQGEFFMPLNPDTELAPDYIERLVAAARQDSMIGTVTGKVLLTESDPGSGRPIIDETGLFLNRTRRQFLRGFGEIDRGQYDTPGYVFGASGAMPLYRRAMLEDIRLDEEYFDTTFFAHKEDVDLAWRAQLRGWKAYYEPTAVAYHHRSFRPAQRKHMADAIRSRAVTNRYLVILKNEHLANFMRHAPWILSYELLIFAYLVAFERSSLHGLVNALRLTPQALRKRRTIMSRSQVDASYIRGYLR